ncbi:MAG: hypothetical protein N4A72_10460 [Bacteroidales bacterium]|jgi:hypothetical protein|nr:hypothetical protein [Bacteroidales bacterium]
MKKIIRLRDIILILVVLLSLNCTDIFARANKHFRYQAVLRDADGNARKNESATITIDILKTSNDGQTVYTETHQVQSNNFGLVNLNIGNGQTNDNFEDIDWSSDNFFIKISLNNVVMGVSEILSVPYALYADKANEVQNLTLNGNLLKITDNNKATAIDLSKYLDNTNLSDSEVVQIVNNNGFAKTSTLPDKSATNEIQDLTLTGDILKITNNASATSIDLSKYNGGSGGKLTEAEVITMVTNNGFAKTADLNDDDATNEIQDLTLTGNSLKVTGNTSATTINLSKYLDNTTLTPTQVDAIVAAKGYVKSAALNDDDATNEIQDLTLTGNSLKVTGNASATTIDLTKYLDNTTLTPTQVDAIVAAKGYVKSAALNDDDATNEIQDLTLTGNSLKVTGNASATTIDLTKYLDNTTLTPTQVDAIVAAKGYVKSAALNDDDATNEIQDLSLTGNSLKVTGNASATTIDLTKYLDNTTLTPTQVDAIVAAKGYIKAAAIATKAEINSPTFTGTPTLPTGTIAVTQSANNNSTKIATTAYVDNAVSAGGGGASDATTTTKGVIKLAGNLGGTADAPKLQVTGNAKGDMLYHDGTEWVRIPAGTDGQVLLMDETEDIPKWVDPSCLRRRVITTVENKTRMIKGEIRANGTVVSGSGFTVNKNGSNDYTISFNEAFAERPIIVSNIVSATPSYFTTEVKSISTSACRIKVIDPVNGSVMTGGFTFIVMGTKQDD